MDRSRLFEWFPGRPGQPRHRESMIFPPNLVPPRLIGWATVGLTKVQHPRAFQKRVAQLMKNKQVHKKHCTPGRGRAKWTGPAFLNGFPAARGRPAPRCRGFVIVLKVATVPARIDTRKMQNK